MSETYTMNVYRREGRLWVTAFVPAAVIHEAVPELYPADWSVEGLTRALLQADRRAHEEMKIFPWSARCRNNERFFLAAGCKSWRQFLRGLTSCHITRDDEGTEVSYWVPDPKHRDIIATTDVKEHYPADISYEELAPIVLRIFATYPPDMQVPISVANPKPLP